MNKKLLLGLLVSALLLPFSLCASAAEEIVFIELGDDWQYIVVDNEGFDAMESDWMLPTFSCNWEIGKAPFGDRIDSSRAEKYGWVEDHHGLFVRTTFQVSDPASLADLNFYINTFYDNTAHIYLNGTEIFSDNQWVDEMTYFKLNNISDLLQKGENLLAVSVHDDVGGREFELSLIATSEELDTSPTPDPDPVPKPDDPDDGHRPAVTTPPAETERPVNPEDFGSSLPFTKVTKETAPPIVTVYVTADGTSAPPADASYTAPLALVGSALIIAVSMVVIACIISHKQRKPGEDK